MPLGDLLHHRYLSHVSGEKRMLPAVHQRSLRVLDQWLSIIDYLCGPDATPARREQLQNLWRAFGKIQTIERAFTGGCGCSVTEFESQWKAWAATAKFGPPQLPPPEIGAVANEEVIPLVRNSAAPIQRRIRAIRTLGRAGWLVGSDSLIELLTSANDDLRRESLSALRLISGELNGQRPEEWQVWLQNLPTSGGGVVFGSSTIGD